jgi:hypothetical protein
MGAAELSAAIKGGVWRSQIAALEQLRWKERVRPALPEGARALLDDPPSILEWVPIEHPIAVCATIERLYGADEVVRFGTTATVGILETSLKPVLQGIFAVFGAKPSSLFGRADLVVKAITRGVSASYKTLGDRAGESEFVVDHHDVHAAYWRLWQGSLVHGFTLCRCVGTVGIPVVLDGGRRARFHFRWD